MALKPRSTGEFPLNRTIPLDVKTDARTKVFARFLAITPTQLYRRWIHEGLARAEAKKGDTK